MSMIKLNILVIIVIFINLTVSVAAALPDHYPSEFFYTGSIDDIKLDEQLIIVGDKGFRVGATLVVNKLNSDKAGTVSSLRRGMNVGVVSKNGESLFELWELPSNYNHHPVDQ